MSNENKIVEVKENKELSLTMKFTREQIEVIKKTVAKGATDEELKMYLYLAQRYNLDPFLHEIWFVKYVGKTGEKTYVKTGRDGYLKVANNDPNFEGLESFTVRENDEFEIDAQNYTIKHKFGKGNRGKIVGAWARADVKGKRPYITWVDIDEYKGTSPIWTTYTSSMIEKCAEEKVLKRAESINGLVTQESMQVIEETEGYIDPIEYKKIDDPKKPEPVKDNSGKPVIPAEKFEKKEVPKTNGNGKIKVWDSTDENKNKILAASVEVERVTDKAVAFKGLGFFPKAWINTTITEKDIGQTIGVGFKAAGITKLTTELKDKIEFNEGHVPDEDEIEIVKEWVEVVPKSRHAEFLMDLEEAENQGFMGTRDEYAADWIKEKGDKK